jgi:hypothetical protein
MNSVFKAYLSFCASLHKFYRRVDSESEIFVFGVSTVVIGFNFLFFYDFAHYYFLEQSPLSKAGVLTMLTSVGIVNYLITFRVNRYASITPSTSAFIGSVVYIIATFLAMVFIGLKYRMLVP